MSNTAKNLDRKKKGAGSNKVHRLDVDNRPKQQFFDFQWRTGVKNIVDKTLEIHEAINTSTLSVAENDFESCIAVAAACKKAITESGLSREQVVDGINKYFGRTEEDASGDDPTCFKPLTVHMFNNYLSKPTVYKLPAYMIFAIQSVCGTQAISRLFAEADGAQVVNGSEVKRLNLLKIHDSIAELKKMEKQLIKSI